MLSGRASPRSCGGRGALLELSLLVALLSPTTASIGCAFGQAPPSFADQALARGVQYPVQAIPQSNGVYGFGVAAADLDGDGAEEVLALMNGKSAYCGSGGCTLFVLEGEADGFFPCQHGEGRQHADLSAQGIDQGHARPSGNGAWRRSHAGHGGAGLRWQKLSRHAWRSDGKGGRR